MGDEVSSYVDYCPWMDDPDADDDGIFDYFDNCPDVPNGPDSGTCMSGSVGEGCLSDVDCDGGVCSMDQEDSDEDGMGDVCDIFGLVSPENEEIVTSAPTLIWSTGDFDLFKVYLICPIIGYGYYVIPPFWYLSAELPFPAPLYDILIPGYPCFWLVIGVNTETFEYEVSEVWSFMKM